MLMQSSGSKAKRPKKSAEPAKNEASAPAANEETPKLARKSPAKKTPAAQQHRGSAKKTLQTKADRNVVEPELPAVTVPTGRMNAESGFIHNAPAAFGTAMATETAPIQESEPAPVTAAAATVSHENISFLAYTYWAERGYQGGSAEEDWMRAEQELLAR